MKASARIKEKRLGRFSSPDLFTDSEQCSFAVHPCTAHYRIFALQKCAAVLRRYDTVIDNLKAEADGEMPEVFGEPKIGQRAPFTSVGGVFVWDGAV